jgi:hypothetical protein
MRMTSPRRIGTTAAVLSVPLSIGTVASFSNALFSIILAALMPSPPAVISRT